MKKLAVFFVFSLAASLIALYAASGGIYVAIEILRYSGPLAILSGLDLFVGRDVVHLWARDLETMQESSGHYTADDA